jgi:hypothetical protein
MQTTFMCVFIVPREIEEQAAKMLGRVGIGL